MNTGLLKMFNVDNEVMELSVLDENGKYLCTCSQSSPSPNASSSKNLEKNS